MDNQPETILLAIDSAIPVTATNAKLATPPPGANANDYKITPTKPGGNLEFGIAPMAVTGAMLKMTVKVWKKKGSTKSDETKSSVVKPIKKAMPAAMWGYDFAPDLNGDSTVNGLCTGFIITPQPKKQSSQKTKSIKKSNLNFETQPGKSSKKRLCAAAAMPRAVTKKNLADQGNAVRSIHHEQHHEHGRREEPQRTAGVHRNPDPDERDRPRTRPGRRPGDRHESPVTTK